MLNYHVNSYQYFLKMFVEGAQIFILPIAELMLATVLAVTFELFFQSIDLEWPPGVNEDTEKAKCQD